MLRSIPIILAALSAALMAACAPEAEGPSPADATQPATRAEPFDLRGQWSVSRIDGESLGVAVSFTGSANALVWQPSCAGQDIAYRTVGDAIEFYQPPRSGPREVCEIGFPDALPRVLEALEGRWDVSEKDNGNLLLTRGERVMVLAKWPAGPSISLTGEWRVAGIDGREFDEPYGIALSATREEIWWEPRCAGQSVRYRIVNDRFVVVEPPPAPPPPPGATRPPPPVVCTIAIPDRLPDVMNAIRAADRIERTPANGIQLSGNGRSLTLFSQ